MKVGAVFDVSGWAIFSHAEGLRTYAPPGITVETRSLSECDGKWVSGLDVLYSMYLPSARPGPNRPKRHVACVGSHAWMHPAFDPNNWRTRVVNHTRNHAHGAFILSKLDAAVCRNEALGRWAKPLCKSVAVFPGGIDPEVFNPADRPANRKLRVGFCGQVSGHPNSDFKGHAEVFVPLAERLGDRYEFVANTNTHATRKTREEQVDFYRSLDIFIHCASADATPITVYEAAACGAVIVSTATGQVADWKTLEALGLVVPDYGNAREAEQVQMSMSAILAGLEDSTYRRACQERILTSVEESYSYKKLAPSILSFVAGVPL